MLRKIIDRINAYLNRYEAAMIEWHETDPEGYYNYMTGGINATRSEY